MSGRAKEELEGVSLLGNKKVSYPTDYAPQMLETFPNKHPENDYFRSPQYAVRPAFWEAGLNQLPECDDLFPARSSAGALCHLPFRPEKRGLPFPGQERDSQ